MQFELFIKIVLKQQMNKIMKNASRPITTLTPQKFTIIIKLAECIFDKSRETK